ncbi:MAG: hypothetical protein JSS60_00155 [Verrucomicrobia bacterium]|nr:hypothetical protein [Verrucomicrobiota bacterium]
MNRMILLFISMLIASISFVEAANEEVSSNEFLTEQIEHLNTLSKAIDSSDTLQLHCERGISFFFIGKFDNALSDFDYVLENLDDKSNSYIDLIGTALWGRLLCHAFKNQLQEACDDCHMIESLFLESIPCDRCKNTESITLANYIRNDLHVIPVVKFANPDEKISKWECHDRTSILADKMRSLSDLVPSFIVRGLVLSLINRLSVNAHNCCEEGHHWTECLRPIAGAWQKLEKTWDQLVDLFEKGIKIETFLVGPNNL